MSIAVKKSYRDGHVMVAIKLKCDGRRSDTATIDGRTDLTTTEARALAQALTEAAGKEDAKMAAKAAAEARREAYREREIAAGRMVVMSAAEMFGRRRSS